MNRIKILFVAIIAVLLAFSTQTKAYAEECAKQQIDNYIGDEEVKTTFLDSQLIKAEDLLAIGTNLVGPSDGLVTGTFSSEKLDTGTPGVKWSYKVNYTIAPTSNGNGWYFKSVSCTVKTHTEMSFYTWATAGIVSITKATHTLSPSSSPTSLTIDISLQFQVWTQATGNNAITYTENLSHTTLAKNMAY